MKEIERDFRVKLPVLYTTAMMMEQLNLRGITETVCTFWSCYLMQLMVICFCFAITSTSTSTHSQLSSSHLVISFSSPLLFTFISSTWLALLKIEPHQLNGLPKIRSLARHRHKQRQMMCCAVMRHFSSVCLWVCECVCVHLAIHSPSWLLLKIESTLASFSRQLIPCQILRRSH